MILSLPLNKVHVMEQLDRVLRVHARPKHAPDDPLDFATDYAQLCGELTSEQFTGAVEAYLRSNGRFFPKPGELLALGRGVARGGGDIGSLTAQHAEWEKNAWADPVTGRWTPCPVCDARMQLHVVAIEKSGAEVQRYLVLHNALVHWKAGIAFTMKAAPGTGGGAYEHEIVDHRPKVAAAPPASVQEVT